MRRILPSKLRHVMMLALPLLLGACEESTDPFDIAGRWTFTWQDESIGVFVPDEIKTLTGTVDVSRGKRGNLTMRFDVPFLTPEPETGVRLGSRWQIFAVGRVPCDPSDTGAFYQFAFTLAWQLDGTCTGRMTVGDRSIVGTCTFTRAGA